MFGIGFVVRKGCEKIVSRMDLTDHERKIGKRIAIGLGVVASVATLDVVSITVDIVDLASSLGDGVGSLVDAISNSGAENFAGGPGTASGDVYYQDTTGAGYASQADYNAGVKMDQSPADGLWYNRDVQPSS